MKKAEQKKNAVTVRADWKSNFYNGPARFEFVLDGEQVRELRITGVTPEYRKMKALTVGLSSQ